MILALKMDTKRGHYHILLSLIDKFFEGYVDQQVFEECVRYIFGAEAHIMFTIDKLVLSIVRHVSQKPYFDGKMAFYTYTIFYRFISSLQIHNLKNYMNCSKWKTELNEWIKMM